MNPLKEKNIRLYILFTIFYNARAYYPVMAVMFVDMGVRLEDYSRLNALWAATILLLEIPSGAMADTIGRKKLVVFSALLMIIEMGLLLCAPINGGALLILMCLTNRILSGISEAASSGADQALAYDTLDQKGHANLWEEKVLPFLMRWRSAAFLVSMLMGGFLYDADTVNSCLAKVGIQASLSAEQTLRLPVLMVFIQGVVCFILALQMQEPAPSPQQKEGSRIKDAFALTLATVKWAFQSKKITAILFGTMLIDAFIRNFATIISEYYRTIDLAPSMWGVMGAISGLIGMVMPSLARRLDQKFPPHLSLLIVGGITLLGLIGIGLTVPGWGIIPSIVCMSTFSLFLFISENNLHKLVDSSRRATLLSVKGMVLNLGYGTASLAFAQAVVYASRPEAAIGRSQESFATVLRWQPLVFGVLMACYVLYITCYRKKLVDPTNPS